MNSRNATNEMAYGGLAMYLGMLVFFAAVWMMGAGYGRSGIGVCVLAVLILLRAGKHVGEAMRLAREEDEAEYEKGLRLTERAAERRRAYAARWREENGQKIGEEG